MKKAIAYLVLSSAVLGAAPALAVDTWIQCDGSVATVGGDGVAGAAKPAHDVFVYNDEIKRLFKYSLTRRSLDPVFVTDYAQQRITWSSPTGSSYRDVRWQGQLDRSTLVLCVVRREKGETMTWTENCKPTQPLTN